MPAPKEIHRLVEQFDPHSGLNETQVRREFIDPFFKALGWDVDNEKGHAQAYKDVIHEDAIKVGGISKAPDYSFRIGGTRKFFVEAKKPAVDLKEDIKPAYQVRRYAWSAKLPLSILTDFEEFVVYDCRKRPVLKDKASTGRIQYFKYTDYIDKWDEIAAIFSREAVLTGSFDKYIESNKGKRGADEVDNAFLKEIEGWRENLAKNIALRNPSLTNGEINFAVQRTVDRIIFLRICEDRGIDEYQRLLGLINGPNIYGRLCELYQKADARYNSGLFHFQNERGRSGYPDELTLKLQIDDKVLKSIIKGLYYPECPYEFSVLPASILGQVYEQFLGKVIHLTAGHHAKIEDKPEVKKAGGVYYTPEYIVDYIVSNTLGKLLEGKTPRQVEKIKVLDPACGSGSFLIVAYQKLVDWHLDYYVKSKQAKHRKLIYQGPDADWRLATSEKKRILTNNIFGVDIDSQAVEVSKLSLLLKVLENETSETINAQLKLFHERVLPDLSDNIKCGNSLIGPDFYDGQQMSLLDGEEIKRVNVFDWHVEFSDIMNTGGFDVVIGNPPYIPIEMMTDVEKAYFQLNHPQLERKFDSSIVFICALIEKLNPKGLLGFISSVTWQTGENYKALRRFLFTDAGVHSLVNLPFDVFKGAYVDTGIYILSKVPSNAYDIYRFPKKVAINDLSEVPFTKVPIHLISEPEFKVILNPTAQVLYSRFLADDRFTMLGTFTISTQGLAGNRFLKSKTKEGCDWYPFLQKGQVYRYRLDLDEITNADMSDKPTLKRFYEECPKILIRRVINRQDRLMATYTEQQLVYKKDLNPFIVTDGNWDLHFLLGVLNSRLISHLYVETSSIATKDDFRQTTLAELRRLPILQYSGDDKHRLLSSLVNRMLDINNNENVTSTPHEKDSLQRQIDATDRQIDQLVYELYGLTEEEIKIVEDASN